MRSVLCGALIALVSVGPITLDLKIADEASVPDQDADPDSGDTQGNEETGDGQTDGEREASKLVDRAVTLAERTDPVAYRRAPHDPGQPTCSPRSEPFARSLTLLFCRLLI